LHDHKSILLTFDIFDAARSRMLGAIRR